MMILLLSQSYICNKPNSTGGAGAVAIPPEHVAHMFCPCLYFSCCSLPDCAHTLQQKCLESAISVKRGGCHQVDVLRNVPIIP